MDACGGQEALHSGRRRQRRPASWHVLLVLGRLPLLSSRLATGGAARGGGHLSRLSGPRGWPGLRACRGTPRSTTPPAQGPCGARRARPKPSTTPCATRVAPPLTAASAPLPASANPPLPASASGPLPASANVPLPASAKTTAGQRGRGGRGPWACQGRFRVTLPGGSRGARGSQGREGRECINTNN